MGNRAWGIGKFISYPLPIISHYFSFPGFLIISRSQVQPGNEFWEVLPPGVQDMS
ncbi:MAG: hypothetical protein VKL59_27200 [Nostocaceae cyanobacterium]|nr:hypothetical protein [Nostocaceae cyanobacterium]